MRRFITLFLMALVSFIFSCKKAKVDTSLSVVGSWELRKAYGGFIMRDTTYFPPGNGNILSFTATTYERISGGRVIETTGYKIIKDTTNGQIAARLVLSNRPDERIIIEIKNDQLTIIEDLPDIGIVVYQRIQ
jgi:hypothetical protein